MAHLPLVALLLVVACSNGPSAGQGPRVSAENEAEGDERDEGDRDVRVREPEVAETPECVAIKDRFRELLAAGSGACEEAADCGCFNPVVGGHGCGGVTDAATAARLYEIQKEFHAADCPWPFSCGPKLCDPKCVDGRCVD